MNDAMAAATVMSVAATVRGKKTDIDVAHLPDAI
jgi:hypothetical protein